MGEPLGAFGVILLFSSFHLPYVEDVNQKILTTALLGASTLLIRVKTDSLFPAMAFHCAYNMFWLITMSWRFGILPS
jgi:membrane protease YdiL (CAAX protease family)